MPQINRAQLEAGIILYLIDHQGEEIPVDDLVRELNDAGLIRSFIEGVLWKLFREDRLVLPPLSSGSVTMPSNANLHSAHLDAHREMAQVAGQKGTGILPAYLEHVLASD